MLVVASLLAEFGVGIDLHRTDTRPSMPSDPLEPPDQTVLRRKMLGLKSPAEGT